jgi:hypothetical protein
MENPVTLERPENIKAKIYPNKMLIIAFYFFIVLVPFIALWIPYVNDNHETINMCLGCVFFIALIIVGITVLILFISLLQGEEIIITDKNIKFCREENVQVRAIEIGNIYKVTINHLLNYGKIDLGFIEFEEVGKKHQFINWIIPNMNRSRSIWIAGAPKLKEVRQVLLDLGVDQSKIHYRSLYYFFPILFVVLYASVCRLLTAH